MESSKHQEWRSRQQINWRAVSTAALFVGGIMFIMSGGSPWSTAGTANAIMGRDVPWGFPALIFWHFAMAYLYGAIIAGVIYRFRIIAALFAGTATAFAIFVITAEVFNQMGWVMQSPSIRALLTHLSFGACFSAVYKGASVPPPLENLSEDDDADETRTPRSVS